MDYDLIVVKTLERVYKNYYYIIRGNIQQSEENEGSGEIEGYSYCNSHKARCLNDCGGNGQATPFLSDLN